MTFGNSYAHDEAHHAFIALPAYTSTREGGVPQLGGLPSGPLSEEMLGEL